MRILATSRPSWPVALYALASRVTAATTTPDAAVTDDELRSAPLLAAVPSSMKVTAPGLIVAAAVIVSLEILELQRISRGIATAALTFMWGTLLTPDDQLSALVGATWNHIAALIVDTWGLRRRRRLALETPDPSESRTRRMMSGMLAYLMRIVAWGVALGANPIRSRAFTFPVAVAVALCTAAAAELTEILIGLYILDLETHRWHRRIVLWPAAIAAGLGRTMGGMNLIVTALASYFSTTTHRIVTVVMSILLLTAAILLWMDQTPRRLGTTPAQSALRHIRQRLGDLIGTPKASSQGSTTRRKSVLYRSSSEVEVVQMQSPVPAVAPSGISTAEREAIDDIIHVAASADVNKTRRRPNKAGETRTPVPDEYDTTKLRRSRRRLALDH